MLKKMMFALVALSLFMVVPAFADKNEGCKNGKFVGSYTLLDPSFDVLGDGSVLHNLLFQLTLHSDGTVAQNWTGLPDFQINTGTGTPWIGSWKCQNNGKLLVTTLRANFDPTPPIPGHTVYADTQLSVHLRNTYLFVVLDDNTLKRVQARFRLYDPTQDPTDPNGGTLSPKVDTTEFTYKRLVASAADLLAP